jgi:protein O-mannosyl-transferase
MKKIIPDRKYFDIKTLGIVLFLFLGTLAIYGQVYNYDFINLDDNLYVYENSSVQKGLTLGSIINSFTSTLKTAQWIPVTWLSFMFEHELFGLNPGINHLTNVFFHATNAVLLFVFFRIITGSLWRSAFVAALFALHPLRVESVAWITERKDVLSLFFMLLALCMYALYVKRPSYRNYFFVFLFFVLGLMAKPMIVTFPCILLLLDYWPLRRFDFSGTTADKNSKSPNIKRTKNINIVLEKIPLFLLSAVFSIINIIAARKGSAFVTLDLLPMHQRIQEAVLSYSLYIGKMVIPRNLVVFYPPRENIQLWEVLCAGLFVVTVTVLVLRFWRRFPYYTIGWLWYLGTLFPVVGIFQDGSQSMADRFTYLPLIGLFVMIAWGVSDTTMNWRHRTEGLSIVMVLILMVYGSITWKQVQHWKNSSTLFSYTLAVSPDNYIAHQNLGLYLEDHGNIKEALSHFEDALKIFPEYTEAQNSLGALLAMTGKYDEAMARYEEALRIKPNYYEVHNNIGVLLAGEGKTNEALAHYHEALKLNPNSEKVHNNIGILFYNNGNLDEAMKHYNVALKLNPNLSETHYNIGIILEGKGKIDEAYSHFSDALKIKPDFPEAHYFLGNILVQQGRFEEAISHYQESIRLKPDFVDAYMNLSDVYNHQGNTDESKKYYNEAIRLKSR